MSSDGTSGDYVPDPMTSGLTETVSLLAHWQQQYAIAKREHQAGRWQNNAPLTTLAGTTAGSIQYAMPEAGSALKIFVAFASGYKNASATAQTITFPTPFALGAAVLASAGMTLTITNTQLTLPASQSSTNSGVILLMGM